MVKELDEDIIVLNGVLFVPKLKGKDKRGV
jgi:hypothetical protein